MMTMQRGVTVATDRPRTIVSHSSDIMRAQGERSNGSSSAVVWFTGLSGAGKSTLSHSVEKKLSHESFRTVVLDADIMRGGLCRDLGFSKRDRSENVRRVGEVAKLFFETGILTLTAIISPYRKDRSMVRALVGNENFLEIYCRCPIEICEARDVKGLYQRARRGEIRQFTGISAPYEEPEHADLVLDTATCSLEECTDTLLTFLAVRGIVPPKATGRHPALQCDARD